jgi:hypothetical protein
MRAMRTLRLGVVAIVLAAFPLGCGESNQDDANEGGHGSGASAGSGGKGGMASGGTTDTANEAGGEGGASADAHAAAAAARLPLCESVCTAAGETSCPNQDYDACVTGWCLDPDLFYPGCQEQSDAFLGCMANEPSTSYECAPDDGRPLPKEEACAGEQSAFVDCLLANFS